MGKIIGRVVFVAIVAFLAYMLITGQVSIAWERIIIYALIGGGISIAADIRAKTQRKRDEQYFKEHPRERPQGDALWKSVDPTAAEGDSSGAAGDMQPPVQGVVRAAAGLRGLINFLLVFIWLMVLLCTGLAAADGAFADMDSGTIGSFGVLIAVVAVFTVLITVLLNHFCCEIYYTSYEVTVKKGRREEHYNWSDIGGYKQTNYLYTFQSREGKKLFATNGSYEGFDGFMAQYRRTHMI